MTRATRATRALCEEGRGPNGRSPRSFSRRSGTHPVMAETDPHRGETEPEARFEQPQDPVTALVRGVRLWKALARLSGHGVPGTPEVRVGKYVLEDVLGEGGMSVVFAARDPELGQAVALKMLKPRMQREQQERLLREGQALARIKSDHVVRVLEIGRHEGAMVLVLERVHGTSLDQWLARRRPDLDGILDLAIQAARGLAAAHRVALVHRDVKPQNVMVADDEPAKGGADPSSGTTPRVYLVDFGLVSEDEPEEVAADGEGVPERLTTTGALVGTLHYMAPEQANHALTDARTDVYGFCVVLYEAVFGLRPYADGPRDEVLAAIRSGRPRTPPLRSRAQRQLWAVLRRGLAKDAGDRFPSMEALLVELERIRRRRDRITRWVLAAAVAGAVAAAAAVGWTMRKSEAREHLDACLEEGRALAEGIAVDAPDDERLTRKVEAYRTRWQAAWLGSCEAEHVPEVKAEPLTASDRGGQPTRACLEEGRRALRADLGLLQGASASERVTIAEGLRLGLFPGIDECTRAAMGPLAQGYDAQIQTEIDNARRSMLLDDPEAAAAALLEVIAVASGLGNRPALARAEYTLARMLRLRGAGDIDVLIGHLRAAKNAAIPAQDDVLLLQVHLEIARVHALDESGSTSDARDAAQTASALLERVAKTLGEREERLLRATLLDVEGLVEFADGKYVEALSLHRRAKAALEESRDPDLDEGVVRTTILINLGRALSQVGQEAEGLKTSMDAIEGEAEVYGALHGELVEGITGIARDLYVFNNFTDAERYATMAIELAGRGRRTVEPRLVLASVLLAEHNFAAAEREARVTASVAWDARMVSSAVQAEVLLGSAMFGDRQEMCQTMLDHFDRLVRTVGEGGFKNRDALLAQVLDARMKNALECRRDELVLADVAASWPLVTAEADRHDLLALQGQALARLGRRAEAILALREALRGESAVPEVRRDATLALAELLVRDGESRDEACELVRGVSADNKKAQVWSQDRCR
ncbi:MAG: serine/threonine-protein kinase [Nannocystaceae bacterium]